MTTFEISSFVFNVGKHLLNVSPEPEPEKPIYVRVTYTHKSETVYFIEDVTFVGTSLMYVANPLGLMSEILDCIIERVEDHYRVNPDESLFVLKKKVNHDFGYFNRFIIYLLLCSFAVWIYILLLFKNL